MRFKISVLILCLVHFSYCKPSTSYLTEGRGIGSTVWGWITYPFSWWSSSSSDEFPIYDQLAAGPATYGPYENIEIAKRNVTVWCNEQTCTTMKCDKFGCVNKTCNIYDTDMKGECREYNTQLKPEEPVPVKPLQPLTDPTLQDKVTGSIAASTVTIAATSTPTTAAASTLATIPTQDTQLPAQIEEHPLELEAVLSSTVTEKNPDKETASAKGNKTSSPLNKV